MQKNVEQGVAEAIFNAIVETIYTSTAGMDEVQSVIATAKSNYKAMTEGQVKKVVKQFNAEKSPEARRALRALVIMSVQPVIAKVALERSWLFEGPLDAYTQLTEEAYSGFNRFAANAKKYKNGTLRFAAFMESTLSLKSYELGEDREHSNASERIAEFKTLAEEFKIPLDSEKLGEKVWEALAASGKEIRYFKTEQRCINAALDIQLGTLEIAYSTDYQVDEEAGTISDTLSDERDEEYRAEQKGLNQAADAMATLQSMGFLGSITSLPDGVLHTIMGDLFKARKNKKSVKTAKEVLAAFYSVDPLVMEAIDEHLYPIFKAAQ